MKIKHDVELKINDASPLGLIFNNESNTLDISFFTEKGWLYGLELNQNHIEGLMNFMEQLREYFQQRELI